MYLSKWTISQDTILKKNMLDAYCVHQRVYDLFPGCRKREFLYHAGKFDIRSRNISILILSEKKPSSPGYGILEVKEIPDGYLDHENYVFTCRIHPVIRTATQTRSLYDEESIAKWFESRGESWGIEFNAGSIQVIGKDSLRMVRGKTIKEGNETKKEWEDISIDYVDVSGILRVTNKELFSSAFRNGLGRAKGFGMGMLRIRAID